MKSTDKHITHFFETIDKEQVNPLVNEILENSQSEVPPNALLPKKAREEQLREELTSLISSKDLRNDLSEGTRLINERLKAKLPEEKWNQFVQAWSHANENFLVNPDKKLEGDNQEIPALYVQLGISEEFLDYMYQVGNELFFEKNFSDAAKVYQVVAVLNFAKANVWMALGLCYEYMNTKESWDKAIMAFSTVILLDPNFPDPYLHIAQCYIYLGDKHTALEYLNILKEIPSERFNSESAYALAILYEQCRS